MAGIAVTAASPPYPNLCSTSCDFVVGNGQVRRGANPGLIWLTDGDLRRVATPAATLYYVLNLRLSDPAAAPAFVASHPAIADGSTSSLTAWQPVRAADGLLVQDEQQVLTPGSWLLLLLAVASVAVLVGGRMAERARRVGLLKAAGGTPGLVGVVLLAENLAVAVAAAAAGMVAGWLAAPLLTDPAAHRSRCSPIPVLTDPGAGLIGAAGAPSLTLRDAGLVVAVALAVALAATLVPAARAARTSTVSALADAARRRGGGPG